MTVLNKESVDKARPFASTVTAPGVGVVSKADLPDPACRWTQKRKAVVSALVVGGVVALEDVAARYALSLDEVVAWTETYKRYGMPGLRVTRCQDYGDHKLRKFRNRDSRA